MNKTRLLSGRQKKLVGANLAADRYEYLDVANAEPDLGIPASDDSLLVGQTDGTRAWSKNLTVDSLTGNIFTSLIDSSDSSSISVVPAVVMNSDLTVENELFVRNDVFVDKNVTANRFIGPITGDVTGNITGDVTGNIYTNTIDSADSSEISVIPSVRFYSDITVENNLFSNDITSANITVDGNATITGDLTVKGTTTTVNSTTLAIGDINITLAKDAENAAQADGAGITVIGPDTPATIIYNGITDTWNLNKDLNVNVVNATSLNGDLTGNVYTNNIDSADSSSITVVPAVVMNSDLTVENELFTRNINASEVIAFKFVGDLQGNVYGNIVGNLTGKILTTDIDSPDSSSITIVPSVVMNSDLIVENDLTVSNIVTAERFVGNVTGQVSDITNHSIGSLYDVDITTTPPVDNQQLTWNASLQAFVPGGQDLGEGADVTFHSLTVDELYTPLIDSPDSSPIFITPAVVARSDLTVENDLYVINDINIINGTIRANTFTGDLIGNVTGNVTGTFTGDAFIGTIDSTDSSGIDIIPFVRMYSDLTVENDLNVLNYLNVYKDIAVSGRVITSEIISADSSTININPSINVASDVIVGNDVIVSGIVVGKITDISNHPLGELRNVNDSTKQDGQYLTWSSAQQKWIPTTGWGQSDFDAALAASTTDDLPEGVINLYFTEDRARSAVDNTSRTLTNLTLTGYLRGPSSFTIDPAAYGDNTGTVIIAGNLQVDGTTTTINSTTVEIDDKNIVLASGSPNSAAADGAGITIDIGSTNTRNFYYDAGDDKFVLDTYLEASVTNLLPTGILDRTDLSTNVDSGDYLLIYDTSAGDLKKATIYNAALQGPVGFTGSQGEVGYTGSKGDTGYVGSQGEVGYTGSKGDTGYVGSQGEVGYTGSKGDTGYVGSRGEAGSSGQDGAAGAVGYTGSVGDVGYTGSQGDVGYTGSAGYTGSIGDLGYTGSQGDPGSSVTIVGSVSDSSQLPTAYSGTSTFVFDNPNGGFSYTVNGYVGNYPTLIVHRGYTYTFDFTNVTSSHPIALRLSNQDTSTVPGTTGNDPVNGVYGSGATVTYAVPTNAPNSIVYQCVLHSSMIGSIIIQTSPNVGDGYITQDTGHLWVWDGSQWNDVGQIVGYTGSVGFTGSRGTDGVIGVDGYTGSVGYTGSQGESSFTWGSTAPVSPEVGDRWFDTLTGALTVYTDDGNTTQWVEVAASGFIGATGYTGSQGVSGYLNFNISGKIVSPSTGVSRFYPPTDITINRVFASISNQATDGDFTFLLNKNGVDIGTSFTITQGDFVMSPVDISVAMTDTDYLTVDVTGVESRDLQIKMRYIEQ